MKKLHKLTEWENHALIARELTALRAENERLKEQQADYEEAYRATISGECAPDEKHCACVPHLRARIAELSDCLTAALAVIEDEQPGVRYITLAGAGVHLDLVAARAARLGKIPDRCLQMADAKACIEHMARGNAKMHYGYYSELMEQDSQDYVDDCWRDFVPHEYRRLIPD